MKTNYTIVLLLLVFLFLLMKTRSSGYGCCGAMA